MLSIKKCLIIIVGKSINSKAFFANTSKARNIFQSIFFKQQKSDKAAEI